MGIASILSKRLNINDDDVKVLSRIEDLYFGSDSKVTASTTESIMRYTGFSKEKTTEILCKLVNMKVIIRVKDLFFLSPLSIIKYA